MIALLTFQGHLPRMQLIVTLSLVIAFVASGSEVPGSLPASLPVRLLATTFLAALLIGMGTIAGRLQREARGLSQSLAGPLSTIYGVAMVAYASLVFGWLRVGNDLRSASGVADWPLVDDGLIASVIALPLMASWYFVERCDLDRSRMGRRQALKLALVQARMLVLIPLCPMLFLLLAGDLVRLAGRPTDDLILMKVSVIALVATPWLLPHWLRWSLNTSPWFDPARRPHVENLLRRAGVPVRQIFAWHTGNRVRNAAATGLWPGPRYLFLSDALLNRLHRYQLAAVVAHEAGHFRQGHLWQGVLSVSLPLLGLAALDQFWTSAGFHQPQLRWTGMVVVFGCWLVFHSRLAKLFEHAADWSACQLLVDERPAGQDELVHYVHTLDLLVEDVCRSGWLHPSNLTRSAFLHHLYRDASFQRVVVRVLSGLKWGLTAAATLLAVVVVTMG